jgi:two-component system NtrC family sensor kinase
MLPEDKISSLGKSSASVVHEINHPLTGILSSVRMIKRLIEKESMGQDDLNSMKKHPQMVYNKKMRLGKTVSSLLPFSHRTPPEFKAVDLNHLLAETLALTEYQMRLQGIKVETRFAPDLLPIKANPAKIKQIF